MNSSKGRPLGGYAQRAARKNPYSSFTFRSPKDFFTSPLKAAALWLAFRGMGIAVFSRFFL